MHIHAAWICADIPKRLVCKIFRLWIISMCHNLYPKVCYVNLNYYFFKFDLFKIVGLT